MGTASEEIPELFCLQKFISRILLTGHLLDGEG